MTRSTKPRRCAFCRGRSPSTHVVKWPRGSIDDQAGLPIPGVVRRYVCAVHASKIVDYQRSTGLAVRAYRVRMV